MHENRRNRILIVGQAKTGTTALFHSIRRSLPKSTHCLFEPIEYESSAADRNRHVLAKVLVRHVKPAKLESFREFERKIVIIRDPRDTLVSAVLYSVFHAQHDASSAVRNLIGVLEQKESDAGQVSFLQVMAAVDQLSQDGRSCLDDFCYSASLFRQFHATAESWHPVRYEDFVAGRVTSLEQYLGLKLEQSPSVPTQVQRVSRTNASGDWKNWLTEADIDALRPLLEPAMRQLGYEDEWNLNPRPEIPPQHGSLYVRRLLKERRQRKSVLLRMTRRFRQTLFPSRKAS